MERLEHFKKHPDFPDHKFSSLGYAVRITPNKGTYVGKKSWGGKRSDGYRQIFGFKPFNLMHQMIAHLFLGPCPEGLEVNHKNRNRSDNRFQNLEYVTRKQNSIHGYWTGPERRRSNNQEILRHLKKVNKGNPKFCEAVSRGATERHNKIYRKRMGVD